MSTPIRILPPPTPAPIPAPLPWILAAFPLYLLVRGWWPPLPAPVAHAAVAATECQPLRL